EQGVVTNDANGLCDLVELADLLIEQLRPDPFARAKEGESRAAHKRQAANEDPSEARPAKPVRVTAHHRSEDARSHHASRNPSPRRGQETASDENRNSNRYWPSVAGEPTRHGKPNAAK